MEGQNSHSTLEMGTSDQVLVNPNGKKKRNMIIAGVVLAVIIIVVVTLAVVLSGNEGGGEEVLPTPQPVDPTAPTEPTVNPEPTDQPPTDQPPTDQPPTDQPPTDQPPTDQPPTDQPPTEPPATEPPATDIPIDLDDIINGKYTPASFSATWIAGSNLMLRNEDDDLIVHNMNDGTNMTLISNSTEGGTLFHRSSRFLETSAEQDYVAFAYDAIPVYRYSFVALYAVVDAQSQQLYNIAPPLNSRTIEPGLQNLVWSPRGNALAFVYKNNIWYKPDLATDARQITTNGEVGVIYNGIPDWVYEEEVFSSNVAMWFSSDGNKIAYATFDDNSVRTMRVPHYGVPGSVLYQYTVHNAIRYPKPGTINPTVSVTLRDLNGDSSTTYNAPNTLEQPILLSVTWVTNTELAIVWTNRVQTEMEIHLCTEGAAACTVIYSYSEPDGWINNNPLIFNADGSAFITVLPQAVNGVRYKQVVQISRPNTGTTWTLQPRSNTAHTVAEIYKWTTNNIIWYKATGIEDSAEQHVYSITNDNVACFTCNIQRSDGQQCLYNEAAFSTDASRVTITCAGPGIPQTLIYNTDGELVNEWELNEDLNTALANTLLPTTIRRRVPVGGGLPDAEVQIQVPHDYETRTNVPLLVYVYGGPDTALVTRQWALDWGTSLVSRFGIAVAHIDGRGSGLQGVDNMFALNRRLGTVEIEDQISVTRYLHENLSWLDSNRTCIWGWSYGGYAASLALSRGDGVFSCAIAVAPVTDWKFYDTIYTERYMGVPENNTEGYTQSSLLTDEAVEGFRNKNYFLIHGTADDNVHYQHSMVLSRRLQIRNIFFTQMSYTDEEHGLVGVRPHLYHGIEKFLRDNTIISNANATHRCTCSNCKH